MKTRMLIMQPDQPHETREVEIDTSTDMKLLASLQAIVEPIVDGYMEHVRVFSDFSGGTDAGRFVGFRPFDGEVPG